MLDDLRHAARSLGKSPGFTAVAVLTLALGIGASTAIFGVINAVVLRPLSFPEPEHLVQVVETNLPRDVSSFSVSVPNYMDWRERSRSWKALAARRTRSANLTSDGTPEHVLIQYVTANYLPALGVRLALGRTFEAEEDQAGRNRVVILTDGLWKRRFGSDVGAIGRSIVLNDTPHTIVGITPPVPGLEEAGDGFVPLGADLAREERDDHELDVFGRLATGVTLEQAGAEMTAIARQIEEENPESNEGWGVSLLPLFTAIVGENVRKALLVLLGAVSLLLLIACANVSNLLLLRATTRSREIAIRVALGSGIGRLVRQLLAESIVLSSAGGLVAVALAFWTVDVVRSIGPAYLPRAAEIDVDARVLAFTSLVAMVTGVLAGLAPVLQALKTDVQSALREKSPTAGPGRWSARNGLVVGQMALSLVLLIGAGLLIRSLHRLSRVDLGLRAENVVTLRVAPGGGAHAFYRQLRERAEALPGVEAVGLTSGVPFTRFNTSLNVFPVGPAKVPPTQSIQADWRIVDGGFFRAMQIPLLRGRLFQQTDDREGPGVVIVNETLARMLWGEEDPVGKLVNPGGGTDYSTVIGVVRDFRYRSPNQPAGPAFFFSAHRDLWGHMTLVVRAAGPPERLVPEVRALVKALDPNLPVFHVATMEGLLRESVGQQRAQTGLFGAFAALAVLLAAVGVYSVMAFTVAQRTREIGVRMALGGRSIDIVRLLGSYGSRLALPGVVIGLAAAAGFTRVLEGLLFEVSPWDPWTYALVVFLLASMMLLACYLPARKAARVDPMVALREE